jgi:predicted nucleic acid-binding protein
MTSYFLDTYALIEITKGKKSFEKYLDYELKTSLFNLYELHYILLRDYGREKAKHYFLQFKDLLIEISDKDIFFGSEFRLGNRKMRFSYTDALGNAIAMKRGFVFLTGDRAFSGFKNVELVR